MRTLSTHTLFTLLWIGIYWVISTIDLSWLSHSLAFDSQHLMSLLQDDSSGESLSYYNTALFFSLIPEALFDLFILGTGSLALGWLLYYARTLPLFTTACYLSLAPIFFFLVRPQKETIVLLLTMCVLGFFVRAKTLPIKLLSCIALYTLYAGLFRHYFFVILALFLFICLLHNAKPKLRMILALLGIVLFIAIPQEFLLPFQQPRDAVNLYRITLNLPGSRSAFFNYLPPEGKMEFVVNYLYALLRLNIPILFHPGIREAFLCSNIALYALLFHHPKHSSLEKNSTPLLCKYLFLSHALALALFEPDLGSYLRHLSSAFLYLVPAIHFQNNRSRSRSLQAQHETPLPTQ